MAKLINYKGKPQLFVMEAKPNTTGGNTVKQLSIKEPNDSRIGVYMHANLVSEDPDRIHPIFAFFSSAEKVRVTFEIIDENHPEEVERAQQAAVQKDFLDNIKYDGDDAAAKKAEIEAAYAARDQQNDKDES